VVDRFSLKKVLSLVCGVFSGWAWKITLLRGAKVPSEISCKTNFCFQYRLRHFF
jgi:hypothetical protein